MKDLRQWVWENKSSKKKYLKKNRSKLSSEIIRTLFDLKSKCTNKDFGKQMV